MKRSIIAIGWMQLARFVNGLGHYTLAQEFKSRANAIVTQAPRESRMGAAVSLLPINGRYADEFHNMLIGRAF